MAAVGDDALLVREPDLDRLREREGAAPPNRADPEGPRVASGEVAARGPRDRRGQAYADVLAREERARGTEDDGGVAGEEVERAADRAAPPAGHADGRRGHGGRVDGRRELDRD